MIFNVAFVKFYFFFDFIKIIEVVYLRVGPILIKFSDKIEKYIGPLNKYLILVIQLWYRKTI